MFVFFIKKTAFYTNHFIVSITLFDPPDFWFLIIGSLISSWCLMLASSKNHNNVFLF